MLGSDVTPAQLEKGAKACAGTQPCREILSVNRRDVRRTVEETPIETQGVSGGGRAGVPTHHTHD